MKRSALWASLLGFVGLVVAALGVNLGLGHSPVLGLDLRGGLSVIYATVEPATEDDLEGVRDLMRDQLEDFGIAEPDVRVEGDNIVVDLPGVSDQEAAFEALQVSGIVTLRPVLQCQPGSLGTDDGGSGVVTGTSVPADETTGTTDTGEPETGESVEEESLGAPAGRSRPLPATPDTTEPDTTEPDTTEPDTTEPDTTEPDTTEPDTTEPDTTDVVTQPPIDDGSELLPYPGNADTDLDDQLCLVGPAGVVPVRCSSGGAPPPTSASRPVSGS